MADHQAEPSRLKHALSNGPVLAILVVVLLYGTGEKCHARLQHLGEQIWPGYFQMRVDPVRPECDPSAADDTPEVIPADKVDDEDDDDGSDYDESHNPSGGGFG